MVADNAVASHLPRVQRGYPGDKLCDSIHSENDLLYGMKVRLPFLSGKDRAALDDVAEKENVENRIRRIIEMNFKDFLERNFEKLQAFKENIHAVAAQAAGLLLVHELPYLAVTPEQNCLLGLVFLFENQWYSIFPLRG